MSATYLRGNYQEAIIAFTSAIEIDPKQAPAYVGRGDAYSARAESKMSVETEFVDQAKDDYKSAINDYQTAISLDNTLADVYLKAARIYEILDDIDSAIEILQQGISVTGSDSLKAYLLEITKEKEQSLESLFRQGVTDDMPTIDDLTFLGKSVVNMDIETAKGLIKSVCKYDELLHDFVVEDSDAPDSHIPFRSVGGALVGYNVEVWQNLDANYVRHFWIYRYRGEESKCPIGFRDIFFDDTLETILEKCGLSTATDIATFVHNALEGECTSQSDAIEFAKEASERIRTQFYTSNDSSRISFRLGNEVGGVSLADGVGKITSYNLEINLYLDDRYYDMVMKLEDGKLNDFRIWVWLIDPS